MALSILFLTLVSLTAATGDWSVMGTRGTEDAPYATFSDTNTPGAFEGFGDMNYLDVKPFQSASGVFDGTAFRAPTFSQLPRVFDTDTPIVFYGFSGMNYLDVKPFQSAWGVFDFSGFKAPTQVDFPRIY